MKGSDNMGHAIQYFSYPEKTSRKEIMGEINDYLSRECACLYSGIRFIDQVFPDYDSAVDYIESIDSGNYDQLAVKFVNFDKKSMNSKRLIDLESKYKEAQSNLRTFSSHVVARDFKSDYVGCRHCGSKINKKYLGSNYCPVCRGDMRSDTLQGRLKSMEEKVKKLEEQIRQERMNLANKKKSKDIWWVIKIEYHV